MSFNKTPWDIGDGRISEVTIYDPAPVWRHCICRQQTDLISLCGVLSGLLLCGVCGSRSIKIKLNLFSWANAQENTFNFILIHWSWCEAIVWTNGDPIFWCKSVTKPRSLNDSNFRIGIDLAKCFFMIQVSTMPTSVDLSSVNDSDIYQNQFQSQSITL